MPRRARVVTWNGKDVPPELLELSAGLHVVEEEPPVLTPEEEAGIEAALESYRPAREPRSRDHRRSAQALKRTCTDDPPC
jgi:hypothetical protein